jgi:hypothetical protein
MLAERSQVGRHLIVQLLKGDIFYGAEKTKLNGLSRIHLQKLIYAVLSLQNSHIMRLP